MSIVIAQPALAQNGAEKTSPIKGSGQVWNLHWNIVASLGLSSGVLALLWNWYGLRPSNINTTRKLKDLEINSQFIKKQRDDLSGLRDRLTKFEQKIAEDLSNKLSKEYVSRSDFNTLNNNVANLAYQLQRLEMRITAPDELHPKPQAFSSESVSIPVQIQPPLDTSTDELSAEYNSAVMSNDRKRLRHLAKAELNITQESEDALTRGTSIFNTQLQIVSGGGSYLLIEHGSGKWICPTAQTLSSFSTAKPQKGIFQYEISTSLPAAELKQPAEVQEIREGIWEIINKGIVLVPA